MATFCKKPWLLLSIVVLLIGKRESVPVTGEKNCSGSLRDPQLVKTLSNGNLNFALDIYKKLSAEDNIFLSPFSISVALAMTGTGAAETTLDQMRDVLHLQQLSEEDVSRAFGAVLNSICSSPNYTLSTANRIYIQNGFPIKTSFVDNLAENFKSGAENVNFKTDADAVGSNINSWVEQQTDKNIKNLFAKGSLGSDTVLVLVNAIYFKGSWKEQFEKSETRPDNFNQANGKSVSVPMMNAEKSFKYAKIPELSSKMLQLDYAGDRLVMYLILPDQPEGLGQLRESLTAETFNSMRDILRSEKVTVKIPKFKLNFKKDLNQVLASLNMRDLFDEGKANLSGIANLEQLPGNLFVSKVVHQAFVEVDEQGTTAAAATGVVSSVRLALFPPPERHTFIADHPFVFVIYDKLSDLIVFIGNVDSLPA